METVSKNWTDFDPRSLSGRNRRLWHEWSHLDRALMARSEMTYRIVRRNAQGLPTAYEVTYHLRSICGVERIDRLEERTVSHPPLFATEFRLRITLPENYPCIDAPAAFRFVTRDEEKEIPHPWHPNIRYFGEFAGRVCLNTPDTYAGLAWCVDRIAHYLSYDRYHARPEPPYPEDRQVAEWVVREGEPRGWIYFDATLNGEEGNQEPPKNEGSGRPVGG